MFYIKLLIIGDKGYKDADSQKLDIPFKETYFNLTKEQLTFNEKLWKVRIIVEIFFGRLKEWLHNHSKEFFFELAG